MLVNQTNLFKTAFSFLSATAFLFLMLGSYNAAAASVTNLTFAGGCPHPENDPTCNNSGNASVENVALLLGVEQSDVTFVGENSLDVSSSHVSITFANGGDFLLGDVSGTWTVTNTDITHLAFKANGYYILAEVGGDSGDWSTDIDDWSPLYTTLTCPAGICNPDARPYEAGDFLNGDGEVAPLSNVTAYTAINLPNEVPLPAAAWLFGSALLGLGMVKRKKS